MARISKRDKMGRIVGVARELEDKECPSCKKQFRPASRHSIFCSRECKFSIRGTREHFETYFWSRVIKTDGCWTWRGKSNGLHSEAWMRGKRIGAHRASWEIANGTIPDGMFVCHKCDNPPCVRPDHLFLGTIDDNNKDAASKNRTAHGSRNGQAKMTEELVLSLKLDHHAGMTHSRMASKYGISRTTVQRIIYGKMWVRVVLSELTPPQFIQPRPR